MKSKTNFRLFEKNEGLLERIAMAQKNEQILRLPNGIKLNFRPGHEYDEANLYLLPCKESDETFTQKYLKHLGKTVQLTVYDYFTGTVKVLAVGENRIFIEIVDVNVFAFCGVQNPAPGTKYWVHGWELPEIEPLVKNVEPSDSPF